MSAFAPVKQLVTKGQGISLNSADVCEKLQEQCPGINFDRGGRQNLWHPQIDQIQGVFYYALHICSMDRGVMPPYPVLEVESRLAKTTVEHALKQDIPLLSLDKFTDPKNPHIHEHTFGYAMLNEHTGTRKIGWRDTFRKLLNANLPGITKQWIEETFKVPMDWYISKEDLKAELNPQLAQKPLTEGGIVVARS